MTFGVYGAATALIIVGLAFGCSGDTRDDELGTVMGTVANPGDTCTLTLEGDQIVRYVNVSEDSLTFEETRTIDSESPGGGALVLSGSVTQGGQKLFGYASQAAPNGTATVAVTYGPRIRGLVSANMQVDNGLLSGSVNGRTFLPISVEADPAGAVFADGQPAPMAEELGLGVRKQLERLQEKAREVAASCELVSTLAEDGASAGTVRALAARAGDPGDFSDTYGAFECNACKAGVVVTATVSCVVACAATFGLGCGACIAGAALAVPAGILGCEQSNACCPVACGGGFPGTCCFGDETCLNGDGLCCSAGKTTCAGKACCGADESCIDDGVNKGTCCADELFCGRNCCDEGETCLNEGTGQCCAPNLVCGNVCCGGAEDTLSYCMNPATSTCCSTLQTECNGKCCPQGQDCVAGECAVVEDTCEMPCTTNADCVGDSHLRCRESINCCVYEPF